MQSLVGLVPKGDEGKETRLIFHLSYDFPSGGKSINASTPWELCSVKYKDLDFAVRACLRLIANNEWDATILWFSKSDLKSVFHLLGIRPEDWPLLMMKACHPTTGEDLYFVDKCLPFGASISCSHFQRFSNGLRYIFEYITKTQGQIPNYLDDFLFIATCILRCNQLVRRFLELCQELGIPVSLEKTEWATTLIEFLGVLLDGHRKILCISDEKRKKALHQLNNLVDKKSAKVKQLQQLAGLLNFLNRAIVPGRAFTQHMYSKFSGFAQIGKNKRNLHGFVPSKLKRHHHMRLDKEFKDDCRMWIQFLNKGENPEDSSYGYYTTCRPFVDLSPPREALVLQFFSDASAGVRKGFGCYFQKQYAVGTWEAGFIKNKKTSITYLELLALCIGVFIWSPSLVNQRVEVACDNVVAVNMVNNTTSGFRNCMWLIRKLVLRSLESILEYLPVI